MGLRRTLLILAMLLCPTLSLAQTTNITATVTDSDSIAWANGTFRVTFVPNPNFSGQYQYQGAVFVPQVYTGTMNGSGAMSVTIPDNNFISPAGTQWLFTICPNASAPCTPITLPVNGGSLNLSSLFSSKAIAPRFPAKTSGLSWGYSTVEINQTPVPGGTFFNVTLQCLEIWSGSAFACSTTPSNFFGVLYIGGPNAAIWGGGDIGAQAMAAYATIPAWGGTIAVLPSNDGACYPWTTPINFSTKGKYIKLVGVTPPSYVGVGTSEQGLCMNWTSTASSSAMTIDWTNTGGAGTTPGGGIENITFWNNSCVTNGGCGSLATGLSLGPVNGGAMSASFRNVKWRGWGSGLLFNANPSQLNFTLYFENFAFQQNTIGVNSAQPSEGWRFTTGTFIQNNTGWAQSLGAGGIQVEMDDVHWDSNTVAGITGNCGGNWTLVGNHFENLGGATTHYIACAGTGDFFFQGGFAGDDNNSSNADYWFNLNVAAGNLSLFSGGETATNVFVPTVMSCMTLANGSPAVLPAIPNGMYCPGGVIKGGTAQILGSSFANIGVSTNGSVFFIHDQTSGGSVVVTVDSTSTSVALSGAAGAAVFVVGAAGSNQIGLQYSGGSLQIEGNGLRVGDTVRYTQVQQQ